MNDWLTRSAPVVLSMALIVGGCLESTTDSMVDSRSSGEAPDGPLLSPVTSDLSWAWENRDGDTYDELALLAFFYDAQRGPATCACRLILTGNVTTGYAPHQYNEYFSGDVAPRDFRELRNGYQREIGLEIVVDDADQLCGPYGAWNGLYVWVTSNATRQDGRSLRATLDFPCVNS